MAPGMPRVIHRSQGLNSSHVEKLARLTLPIIGLCCACGVNGGTLPSGGSTTSEVCFDLTPKCSCQCSGLLRLVRVFCSRRFRSWAASSATSASVRRSLPANSGGRSNGVAVLFVHIPCRSGSPHGVRVTRESRVAVPCAATGIGVSANSTTGHAMTRAAIAFTNRALIRTSRSAAADETAETISTPSAQSRREIYPRARKNSSRSAPSAFRSVSARSAPSAQRRTRPRRRFQRRARRAAERSIQEQEKTPRAPRPLRLDPSPRAPLPPRRGGRDRGDDFNAERAEPPRDLSKSKKKLLALRALCV